MSDGTETFAAVRAAVCLAGIFQYKKVILFGSEGNAKTFSSKFKEDAADIQLWKKNNLPVAQIDVCDS